VEVNASDYFDNVVNLGKWKSNRHRLFWKDRAGVNTLMMEWHYPGADNYDPVPLFDWERNRKYYSYLMIPPGKS
jgi:hypothetical protein